MSDFDIGFECLLSGRPASGTSNSRGGVRNGNVFNIISPQTECPVHYFQNLGCADPEGDPLRVL